MALVDYGRQCNREISPERNIELTGFALFFSCGVEGRVLIVSSLFLRNLTEIGNNSDRYQFQAFFWPSERTSGTDFAWVLRVDLAPKLPVKSRLPIKFFSDHAPVAILKGSPISFCCTHFLQLECFTHHYKFKVHIKCITNKRTNEPIPIYRPRSLQD